MIFAARTLTLGSEPVPETDLVIGHVYFKVYFSDEACVCPSLFPVVFLGRGAAGHGDDTLVFQDESYLCGVKFGDELASGLLFSVGDLNGVYDYETALEILLKVSLKRQQQAKT